MRLERVVVRLSLSAHGAYRRAKRSGMQGPLAVSLVLLPRDLIPYLLSSYCALSLVLRALTLESCTERLSVFPSWFRGGGNGAPGSLGS